MKMLAVLIFSSIKEEICASGCKTYLPLHETDTILNPYYKMFIMLRKSNPVAFESVD